MTRVPWALERAGNPTVLRLHTTAELTEETIQTCPPDRPPWPLDRLLSILEVRSIDLHRYGARLNLRPGVGLATVEERVREGLVDAWGPPVELPPEAPVRDFPLAYRGPRLVAESLPMAGSNEVLRTMFGLPGVEEAIVGEGAVRIRPGRLFSWQELEPAIRQALESMRKPTE